MLRVGSRLDLGDNTTCHVFNDFRWIFIMIMVMKVYHKMSTFLHILRTFLKKDFKKNESFFMASLNDIFRQSASILHIDPKTFAAGTQLEDFFDGLALRESSYRW